MGNVPWVIPSIIFSPELKPKAMSLGTSLTWMSASIVMFLFPYLQKWFGQFGLMMILTGINFLSFLIGIFFVDDYKKVSPIKESSNKDDPNQGLMDEDKSDIN